MPEMQEQFPARAWTARNAENGGAFLAPPVCNSNFIAMDGVYAGNAGANFRLVPGPPGMLKTQEQF